MQPFKHWIVIAAALSLIIGFSVPCVRAQDAPSATFAGIGYSIELPEGWSGKSNYFVHDSGLIELTFLMPSSVPDLPFHASDEDIFEVAGRLGQHIVPGYWLEELTTQPGVVVYNARTGGHSTIRLDQVLLDVVSNPTDFKDATFNVPTAATVNGLDALIVTGTIVGGRALAAYTYSFYAMGIQQAGQFVAVIGYSAAEITPDGQAIFEAVTQSFKFEPLTTLKLPKSAPEQLFQEGPFSFSYPNGWELFPLYDIPGTYVGAFAPQGMFSEAQIQNMSQNTEITLNPGEHLIFFVYIGPLDGQGLPVEMALLQLPGQITEFRAYTFEGETLYQYKATAASFEAAAYVTKLNGGIMEWMLYGAPGEPLDTAPLDMMLATMRAQ